MTSPVVAAPVAACAEPATVRAYYFITAPAHPGLLPRLIEPVAKLGAVPARVHASRESGDGSELSVELRLAGVAPRTADLIARALRAVVGVRQVKAVVEPEGTD
jgi:acetolactate synthase regulatory subunit